MNSPTDSVRIVLFDGDDPSSFLVLTEVDDPENWKLPGGKFDTVDETPSAAADRELREELGLTTEAVNMETAGRLVNDDGVSARHIFIGSVTLRDVLPSSEIAQTKWIRETDIPASPNQHHMQSAVQQAKSSL